MSSRAVVTGRGFGLPAAMQQADLWSEFFAEHYSGDRLAERLWRSVGIATRHGVADPRVEDVSRWGTGARMRRYAEEAAPLGKEAIAAALAGAGIEPGAVGLLAVASCTGYATPGLDIVLARDLGMSNEVQRLLIGHMGCYAALPALGTVADFVVARGRPAVLLCVELPSLHLQPPSRDIGQMVAHALFSDAAAAIVLEPAARARQSPAGLELVDLVAVTDHASADHMTWDVTELGFRMGLSPRVPDVLGEHVAAVVADRLLRPHQLAVDDVAGWAVHPGGRRILEVVAERLRLAPERLRPSYDVLESCGNCSSATVLMVLDRLLPAGSGAAVVALAFGPGLTLYAALLRQR